MTIFDEDIPEIAVTEDSQESASQADSHSEPVAKKFAFVGVGAAGGRIVNEFFLKGYRKAVVMNTCLQDSADLDDNLAFIDMNIKGRNISGCGKDPTVSRALLRDPRQRVELTGHFKEIIGDQADYIFVCAGLGGGTGSGGGPELVSLIKEYLEDTGSTAKVGCILTLPQPQEGSRVAVNALDALVAFKALNPTPMLIIDNGRVGKMRGSTVASLYSDANRDAALMLHSFNELAAKPARQTFDGSDFGQLLNSGMITLGMGGVRDWSKGADVLAKTILSLYQSATLADMDTSTATQGVCVIAAGSNVYKSFSNEELMRGLDMLRNSSRCQTMMLHSGFYEIPDDRAADTLRVYVGLGGLQLNSDILKQLAKTGVVDFESKLANFFGIK